MLNRFFTMALCIGLISCASYPQPTVASEMPNILVMGDDADHDTVPRNSRVFKRVLDALSNEMNDEGFNVFDETAVSLDDFAQGRVRRTDAEIIDVAKSIQRPPIDVAVIFSIYAQAKKLSYTTKVHTRIAGRLLNVRTGQRLGNFEVESPKGWRASPNCNRDCILEVVGKHSKILSRDLGAVLATKLAYLVDGNDGATATTANQDSQLPTAYTLVFEGFTPDEVNDIEEYLVAFKGYKHHRPINSGLRTAEYWYETKSNSARLNRNLRKMMDHLGVQGRVAFSGSTYTVQKITKRKNR